MRDIYFPLLDTKLGTKIVQASKTYVHSIPRYSLAKNKEFVLTSVFMVKKNLDLKLPAAG